MIDSPAMTSIVDQSTERGAWVISDQSGLRQQLLYTRGFRPVHGIHFDLHSQKQYNHLANRLTTEKPTLVWARLAGPACGSGNRKDDRRAAFLVRLVFAQLASHRLVVVEGNIRSNGWDLRPVQELQRGLSELHETMHRWCRYQPDTDNACGATTRVRSNVAHQLR